MRVDASAAPIGIGDLLVTSDRAGMAMKSEPMDINGRKLHQPGTIVGKALEPLQSSQSEIWYCSAFSSAALIEAHSLTAIAFPISSPL